MASVVFHLMLTKGSKKKERKKKTQHAWTTVRDQLCDFKLFNCSGCTTGEWFSTSSSSSFSYPSVRTFCQMVSDMEHQYTKQINAERLVEVVDGTPWRSLQICVCCFSLYKSSFFFFFKV